MKPRQKPLQAVVRDLDRQELGEVLNLSPETITDYKSQGAPCERRGRKDFYNAGEFRAWMAANGKTGGQGRPIEGDSPDLEAARLRKENALASKYELQVQRERGELVAVEEIKRWIGEHVTAAKNKFIGFGAGVTPQLEGRDAAERQGIIDARVGEILNELAAA